MSIRSDSHAAYVVGQSTFAIRPGVTLAAYVGQEPARIHSHIRYVTGGSLLVIGTKQAGVTLAGASLVASSYYLVNSLTELDVEGPFSYYLAAVGATVTVSCLWEYSEGASLL